MVDTEYFCTEIHKASGMHFEVSAQALHDPNLSLEAVGAYVCLVQHDGEVNEDIFETEKQKMQYRLGLQRLMEAGYVIQDGDELKVYDTPQRLA